jgi:hypothetical protein
MYQKYKKLIIPFLLFVLFLLLYSQITVKEGGFFKKRSTNIGGAISSGASNAVAASGASTAVGVVAGGATNTFNSTIGQVIPGSSGGPSLTADEQNIANLLGLSAGEMIVVRNLTPAQKNVLFSLNTQNLVDYDTVINKQLLPSLQNTYNTCVADYAICSTNLPKITTQYNTCNTTKLGLQKQVGLCNNFMLTQQNILQPSPI